MRCKFCHSEIIEFVKWLFHEKKQVRRFECPVCGPLDYRTLEPLTANGEKP